MLAPLIFALSAPRDLDFRSVPAPLIFFIAYQRHDFPMYKSLVTASYRVLEPYKKLSLSEKKQQLRRWVTSIQLKHESMQSEYDRKKVGPHYDEENSSLDISKIDIFRLADNKPMIFHSTERYLRLFYNAPGKGFTIQIPKSWPKRLATFDEWDYHGAAGNQDNANHYSFEPMFKKATTTTYEWVNSNRP